MTRVLRELAEATAALWLHETTIPWASHIMDDEACGEGEACVLCGLRQRVATAERAVLSLAFTTAGINEAALRAEVSARRDAQEVGFLSLCRLSSASTSASPPPDSSEEAPA